MRKFTSEEVFTKGFEAFNKNDIKTAEQWFLANLFRFTNGEEEHFYPWVSGSLDYLSIHIYPFIKEDSERTKLFYKHLKPVCQVALKGYISALVNGVLGKIEFDEALKQLAILGEREESAWILAHFHLLGLGDFEIDQKKAWYLLMYLVQHKGTRSVQAFKKLEELKPLSEGMNLLNNDPNRKEIIDAEAKKIIAPFTKSITIRPDPEKRSEAIKYFIQSSGFEPTAANIETSEEI